MKTINIKNINPIDYITIDLSEFSLKKDKEIKEIIETVEEDDRNKTPLEAEIQIRFIKELKEYLRRRKLRKKNLKTVKKLFKGTTQVEVDFFKTFLRWWKRQPEQ